MSNNKRKTKNSKKINSWKKSKRWAYILITLIIIAFIIFLIAAVRGSFSKGNNSGDAEESNAVTFPWESDDGMLRITALIQFSGPNMDEDNQEGEDIAGIQIENISDQYIGEATIALKMEDGQEFSFLIQNLPAGEQTVAFEQASLTYDGKAACTEITCSAVPEDISMAEDRVSISTDGAKVIITNISDQQIDNAAVIYRCMSGDSYMGGISYMIQVSGLAAGESFEYEDTACLFGTPQVVGVEID